MSKLTKRAIRYRKKLTVTDGPTNPNYRKLRFLKRHSTKFDKYNQNTKAAL